MAQAGYTPIQLYLSTTASAVPSAGNLANGELAINITDGKLFYKDNGGVVQVLAGKSGTGVVAGSNTQLQFNNNGVFGASSGLTWDGTNLTASQVRSSGLTSGRVTYAGASGQLVDSANLLYSGTDLTVYGITVGRGAGGVAGNTVVGYGGGSAMTTGAKNTILGAYSGNQGGLDIRTQSGYIVLSDGDGNPNMAGFGQTEWLMRSGAGYWTLYSNGGGNNSTYNGTLIGSNKNSITGQSNNTLPSWFIDIGGRAADGSTRPVSTADKFSVGRQAAGGTIVAAPNLFEVNSNGAVGLNTTAASTGTGITFPATQSASSDPNTLDDYEEGTWTTNASAITNCSSVSVSSAIYVKVGRQVTGMIAGTFTVTASGANTYFLFDVPFNSQLAADGAPGQGTYGASTNNNGLVIDNSASTSYQFGFWVQGVNNAESGVSKPFQLGFTYIAAA